MSNENGSAPANPTPYMDQTNGSGELYCYDTGLTKREHFAGLVMQGMLSSKHLSDFVADSEANKNAGCYYDGLAIEACKYADALLKELKK